MPDDRKRYVKEVGLDVEKFDACVASGTHKEAVQEDLDDGNRLGITGTPAYSINGRSIRGASPIDVFARTIDDELARTARAGAKAQ